MRIPVAFQTIVVKPGEDCLGVNFLMTILALRHCGMLPLVTECAIEFRMLGLAFGQRGKYFRMTRPAVL